MKLEDDIDFTTLSWVKRELDETLNQARLALQAYVEDSSDTSQMRFCATYLHQVHGTLAMVELHGAAMVVEEMELAAKAILDDEVEDRNAAFDAMIRGMVQLPDYLERLQSGHRDIPIVLLPLLNEVRAIRGEAALTEMALFAPRLDVDLPVAGPGRAVPDVKMRAAAVKLRKAFEQSLLGWLRAGKDVEASGAMLGRMVAICDKLASITHAETPRRLWWIAASVLQGIREGAVSVNRDVKLSVGRIDQEMKRQAIEGERAMVADSTDRLSRQLLFIAATEASEGCDRVDELNRLFNLSLLMPDPSEVEHAMGSMTGHNRALLDTVSGAIKEDLMRVKDGLDFKVRQNDMSSEGYDSLTEHLDKIADTLGMLGLEGPRNAVVEERGRLQRFGAGEESVSEESLMDVASSMLYVEAALDNYIDRLGSAEAESDEDRVTISTDLPSSEVRRILDALMKESSENLQEIKRKIVEFIEAPWDHERVTEAPRLLQEIVGALRMLDLTDAADLLQAVIRFIDVELLKKRSVPTAEQLDTLADAVASIEYFLEAVREHRPGRDKILDVARSSLDRLGYLGEAGERLAAEAAEAYPEPEPEPEPVKSREPATVQIPVQDVGEATGEKKAPVEADIDDDIDEEIREVFIEEVEEELKTLDDLFPVWRDDPEDQETLATIRRTFHTLKGSGRLVGAHTIGEFSWQIENLLNRVLDGTRTASPAVISLLGTAVGTLPELLANVRGEGRPTTDIEGIKQVAERLASGEEAVLDKPARAPAPDAAEQQPEEAVPEAPAAGEAEYELPEDLATELAAADDSDEDMDDALRQFEAELEALERGEDTSDEATAAREVESEETVPEPDETAEDDDEAVDAWIASTSTGPEEPGEADEAYDLTSMIDEISAAEAATGEDEEPGSEAASAGEEEATGEPEVAAEDDEDLEETESGDALAEFPDFTDTEEEAPAGDLDVGALEAQFEELEREGDVPEAPEAVEGAAPDEFAAETDEAEAVSEVAEDESTPAADEAESGADAEIAAMDPGHAEDDEETEESYEGSIDPVLLDILRSEVSGHLAVIEAYLDDFRNAPEPLAVTEPLLRAVHTLNGAVAMVDVAPLTTITAPLERYVKRLRLLDQAPNEDGIAALEESMTTVRDVVAELEHRVPHFPDSHPLGERLHALGEDLPEPGDVTSLFPVEDEPLGDLAETDGVDDAREDITEALTDDGLAEEVEAEPYDAEEAAAEETADEETEVEEAAADEAGPDDSEAEEAAAEEAAAEEGSADEAGLDDAELEEAAAEEAEGDEAAAEEAQIGEEEFETADEPEGLESGEFLPIATGDALSEADEPEFSEAPAEAEPSTVDEEGEEWQEEAAEADFQEAPTAEHDEDVEAAEPLAEEADDRDSGPIAVGDLVAAWADVGMDYPADLEQEDATEDDLAAAESTEAVTLESDAEETTEDESALTESEETEIEVEGTFAGADDDGDEEAVEDAEDVTFEEWERAEDEEPELETESGFESMTTFDADSEYESEAEDVTDLSFVGTEVDAESAASGADETEAAEEEAGAGEETAEEAPTEETEAAELDLEGDAETEPSLAFDEGDEDHETLAAEETAEAPADEPSEAVEIPAMAPVAGSIVPTGEPEIIAIEELGEIDGELLEIFIQEGEEILDEADHKMVEFREQPDDPDVLTALQRELHTLKGGARMAGVAPIGDLSHSMESMFEAIVSGALSPSTPMVELLEHAFDRLHQMLGAVSQRNDVPGAAEIVGRIDAIIAGEPVERFMEGAEPAELPDDAFEARTPDVPVPVAERRTALDEEVEQRGGVAAARPQQEMIRVRADLLDNLVNYAGEVSIYRARLDQQVGTFRFNLVELDQTVARLRDQLRKLEIETEAQILSRYQREGGEIDPDFDPLELDRYSQLQQYSRALAESVADLVSIQSMLDDLTRGSETLLLQQSRVNSDLQEGLMRTRMVPFDSLVPRLRRILRQTSGELGKRALLRVEGAQGEMDRTVLERITAPLEHMLRNAVAHGLETPEQRSEVGKSEEGNILIRVSREATEVVIRVIDDGAGIDPERVREKAIERGLLKADADLTERDLYGFILQSGFSTAEDVSKIAGRGVGMDVVNSEIKQLGGSLDISSRRGEGTTFTIRLPFTLAVTHAIMVRIGDAQFAIPLSSIEGVVRMSREDFEQRIASGDATYEYGGETYQLHELDTLLGLDRAVRLEEDMIPIVMSRIGDQRAGIRIDHVMSSREIVVKSVGPQISSIPGIFGATILGDGSVIMILDLGPLIRRGAALRLDAAETGVAAEVREAEVAERLPLIMVVDDSITMRKVTSRVLERHEMEVITAKDGVDAVEQLQERIPDLMLLDIEMPRMDGYELAQHMRNDPRLRNIPIIMITSRTGEKHRQRALEIGVNRYLGKPYQEADLLENVQELLEETVGTG